MKINFDFNPNSEKQETVTELKINLNFITRQVIILNTKYKCKCFENEESANEYLKQNPEYELLSYDNEGFNVIPKDYYGVEVVFNAYEFKKHYEGFEKLTEEEKPKKHTKVTWIAEESTIKPIKRQKR